ncbi:hypothetical protein [Sabulicella glaciei]|uniref:Metal-sensing transcriptional repressor n=1 Tax=Sabulicella glaciei TaxID=2984948 RepID=A0ABT3P1P8_9PROT|nr:hypothetical protein [Roseococcus sp. MDT2-1-1]MCW8088333.1 hypothetical protein [Roseococcus sp. MDT2-1-1]
MQAEKTAADARREVRECEVRIKRQIAFIAELKNDGIPHAVAVAQALLATMQNSLDRARATVEAHCSLHEVASG